MLVPAFLERGIFTHLFALFIRVRLIISVHGWYTAVRVRHELSRIVAAHVNLATRLGSSRSVNFFRGRYTLAEVHLRYPFSRHDFRCDGWDSRWRFVRGRNYPANHHNPSGSVTLCATRYGSGVLDMSATHLLTYLHEREHLPDLPLSSSAISLCLMCKLEMYIVHCMHLWNSKPFIPYERIPLFPRNSTMPTTEILLLEESTDGGELPISVNCNYFCFPMFPSDSLDMVSDFIKCIFAFFCKAHLVMADYLHQWSTISGQLPQSFSLQLQHTRQENINIYMFLGVKTLWNVLIVCRALRVWFSLLLMANKSKISVAWKSSEVCDMVNFVWERI